MYESLDRDAQILRLTRIAEQLRSEFLVTFARLPANVKSAHWRIEKAGAVDVWAELTMIYKTAVDVGACQQLILAQQALFNVVDELERPGLPAPNLTLKRKRDEPGRTT